MEHDFLNLILIVKITQRDIFRGKRKESRKKAIFLMTVPLRPQTPPPSSLMAVETSHWEKKNSKKRSFSLLARPLSPPS